MKDYMLTTLDNPYNPFHQFDEWFNYDQEKGYGTCELLSRFAKLSDALSEAEVDYELESAIDEIVDMDPLGIYIKIYENSRILPPGEGA